MISHAQTNPGAGPRVLLAEDNLTNQKVAAYMLERLGCQLDIVDDGAKAVAAVAKRAYDVVFMDCQMPVMDGYAATALIRKQEGSGRHTIIIALTANSMLGDREKCLGVGMDDFLTKPVHIQGLREAVARWWRATAPVPAAASAAPTADAGVFGCICAAPAHAAAGFDPAVLAMLRRDGGKELVDEVIDLFLTDAPAKLATIAQAIATGNGGEVARAAHRLKGSGLALGLRAVATCCQQLEAVAKDESPPQLRELAAQLAVRIDQASAILACLHLGDG